MPNIMDLAVELQLHILHSATHQDHPRALEYPLINWHSDRTLFFERTLKQRGISLVRAILMLCGGHPI